ncbi:MAG: transglycosylase SLT domain-containing protein [Flavobacteriales bacterium]|nr:transglycosylase SLT domain-containing protein [Flavobacteriales bacterium]
MMVRERTGIFLLLGAALLASVLAWIFHERGGRSIKHVPWDHPQVERDLADIVKDTLRVLVLRDPLSWEQRPGAETGLEYELLERFADHGRMRIKVIAMDRPDSMLLALQQGRGDVIAAQYTPRADQEGWVALTRHYHTVRPMIARMREDPLLRKDAGQVFPEKPALSIWSPFAMDVGIAKTPHAMVDTGTPEELLMEVVMGRRAETVVTDAVAGYEARRFPTLEFTPMEGEARPLCFAVRTNAPDLLHHLEAWLGAKNETTFRSTLIEAYLDRVPEAGALRKRSMPVGRDSISPYDPDFRKHGGGFGWKWQLLAAMAWKESRFDSTAVSEMGAAGIMQLMPRTAERLGVDSSLVVADHISAAKRYISRLDTLWMRAVPDRDQRLRFVLASYNAGPGHIIDAQRLAERLGLDPKRWEHNVERAVLLLAKPRYYMRPEMKNGFCKGSQVFHYVRDIVALYGQLVGMPAPAPVPTEVPPSVPDSVTVP